ncbi:MAG: hypothetical protein ABI702_16485 [Burkholderiales bacterium]
MTTTSNRDRDRGPGANPGSVTPALAHKAALRMTRPPTPEELRIVQAMWARDCDEQGARVVRRYDPQEAECCADSMLADIDNGRNVLKLLPRMSREQLHHLSALLVTGDKTPPWLAPTRSARRHIDKIRNEPIPVEFVTDQIRGIRRDRMHAKMLELKARRLESERIEAARSAKAAKELASAKASLRAQQPAKVKPRIRRKE